MSNIFLDRTEPHIFSMSLSTRLPPELWCAVWEGMPLKDRVAVSHVCRYWRDISVHCPTLWQHLEFFSTVHGDDCVCELCGTWDDSDAASPVDDEPRVQVFVRNPGPPPGWNNFCLIIHLVARSCALPLYFTMDVGPFFTDLELIDDLGVNLAAEGASDRIVSITAVFDDPSALKCLLGGMKHLPALQYLNAERASYPPVPTAIVDTEHWYRDSDHIDMPSLQAISLTGVGWMSAYQRAGNATFPSLTSVECAFFYPEEVEILLDACPALDKLVIDASAPLSDYSWRLEPGVLSKLDRIPVVRVEGVTSDSEAWAIDNFRGSPSVDLRTGFALQYSEQAIPELGLENITLDLPEVEYFGFTLNGTSSTGGLGANVTLRSSQGPLRSLHFSARHFDAVSGLLVKLFDHDCRSIKELLLPYAFISTFIRSAHDQEDVVRPAPDLLTVTDADLDTIAQYLRSAFPCLKVVHFLSRCHDEPQRKSVDVLVTLLRSANSDVRLDRLMIEDVERHETCLCLRIELES
ncbi:hypothetical protein EXIGLDRAFT_831285 [Exidia glandulosa HHB12029]|uniref:F-box domain-containing protein n=1 Tax=Exidia glandulosa HHB12029 TaxID=1314781 RepID=A0A165MTV1_EXIGL|nr:hypothetical protein EXIGLDRAFT_831285 [Exidia glandulosa HHB12029]